MQHPSSPDGSGQSTPMTYESGGKQYVVTVDGGHGSFGTKLGDYVRACAAEMIKPGAASCAPACRAG